MKKLLITAGTVAVLIAVAVKAQTSGPVVLVPATSANPASGPTNNPTLACWDDGGYCQLSTDSVHSLAITPSLGASLLLGGTPGSPLVTINTDGGFILPSGTPMSSASSYKSSLTTVPQFACTGASTCTLQSASGQTASVDCGGGTCTAAVGNANATTVLVGSVSTGTVNVQGTNACAYTIGTATHTGTLTFGNSTTGETVNIASGGPSTAVTNVVNVGTGGTSTAVENITLGSSLQNARSGLRNASSRIITANKPVASPDCAGTTLNLSVTQFLDAAVFTCATAQIVNFPTWQGASGIVQNLPGTPAVGDVGFAPVGVATAANAITIGAGTGGTLRGVPTTVAANASKQIMYRLTSVTSGSETADVWILGP